MARLPSLPAALLQIMELAERDDVGLADLAAAVSRDAALAAKVLSTANSAYYSRGRSIATLEQCLSVLGAAQVRRIALNQSVAELFSRFQPAGGFDMRYYWYHVLCVAITAREVARILAYPQADEAYLAGLLHDVGQLALLAVDADAYMPIFQEVTGERGLMDAENRVFNLTHAEVGAWLAQRWNLHAFFADALLYHHEPLPRLRDAHILTQVVALASLFNNMNDGECTLEDADLAFWQITVDQARNLVTAATGEAKDIAEALGLEIKPRKNTPRITAAEQDPAESRLATLVSTHLEAQNSLPETLAAPDRESLFLGLVRSARMLFASPRVALFLAQDGLLKGQALADDDSRLAELAIRLPGAGSPIAKALEGQPTLAGKNPDQESLADAQVLRIFVSERLLCLPLIHASQALGVLVIGLDAAEAQDFLQRKALIATFSREGGRRLGEALAQLHLAQSGREAALAEFQLHARKVVHEANNPLGVVRNYIALLREQMGDKTQAQEDFDLVESELRRVARILQDMKNPAASVQEAAARVDLNALINDVIRFCRMGRPEMSRVETHLDLDTSLPAIQVNGDKVKQLLTNLIFNAAEAMPEGGSVNISSAAWQSAMGQQSVEITVSDTGPGLPANVLDHLYQPVHSQKGGVHQGLGLSIVGKLVEELGGKMQCKSSRQGTSFKILLPAGQPGP
jgi:HD-like signal output (HDOD) protein/signal transduction histidine kinase